MVAQPRMKTHGELAPSPPAARSGRHWVVGFAEFEETVPLWIDMPGMPGMFA